MACIVLAGGEGRRLGGNKLLEVVGGETLLQRVINSLAEVEGLIHVIIGAGQRTPPVRAPRGAQVTFLHDLYPGAGVLGGIYTGLMGSESARSLVVGADMPFLVPGLLKRLLELSEGYDVVMPRLGGLLHPLHAVYSRHTLGAIQHELETGQLQIRAILHRANVRYVEEDVIDPLDPAHLSFFNVNTAEDLIEARRLAGSGSGL